MRFLHIAADGETILATLTMTAEEAGLAVAAGQVLLAVDPETDDGAWINDARFKVNMTGSPVLTPRDPAYPVSAPANINLAYVAV